MALPTGGPWPPAPYGTAAGQLAVWDSWIVGDPSGLTQSHQTQDGGSGGLVGIAQRVFWGKPSTRDSQAHRRHLPVAADLCRVSSQLLFARPPLFTVPAGNGNTQAAERVDRIFNTATVHAQLLEGAYYAAGLGGTYLRGVWDRDVADHVMVDVVDADAAIPEWTWGRLTAVTFFTEVHVDKDRVWRHLERHEPGRILHGLYAGTADKLGAPQPLDAHPATAGYAVLVDADGAIPTGAPGLTAAYVPNARPNPAWRRHAGLRELGKPDLAGLEPLMGDIDEAWSSLVRDVRLAKARLIVPEYMLTSQGRGRGAHFDPDQELFTGLSMPPTDNAATQITAQQFAIRVSDHLGVINAGIRFVVRAAGYSPITFGLPDEVAATATEVSARKEDTLTTRSAKAGHWASQLGPLLMTLLQVDAAVFGTRAQVGETLDVVFPPGDADPLATRAASVDLLHRAQAASTETLVKIVNPHLDGDAVTQEVNRILAEQGMAVPDPGMVP